MNDYRSYKGVDFSSAFIAHYGVSKRDGAKVGSGRYPLHSGERPDQWKEREGAKSSYRTAKDKYKSALRDYRSHSRTAMNMNDNTKTTQKALASKWRTVEKLRDKMDESRKNLKDTKRRIRKEIRDERQALYEREEEEYNKREAEEQAKNEAEAAERKKARDEKREKKEAEKLYKQIQKGKVDERKLSDEALNTAINRIRKEDTLRQLMGKKTLSQSVNDSPKALMADAGKNIVKEGLKSLVSNVIVPTATGYLLYNMAQHDVDKQNATIDAWNKANPDDQKERKKDIDFTSTVFSKVRTEGGGKGGNDGGKGNNGNKSKVTINLSPETLKDIKDAFADESDKKKERKKKGDSD